MAIDIDVQSDNFPYLARQIQGDIAKAFGYGIDHVYEQDIPFLNFLSNFSIDNLDGKWLDMLGVILGLPRPYSSGVLLDEAFEFDSTAFMLDGVYHGFSTTVPVTIEGVTYDRSNGGLLDDVFGVREQQPISDVIYKKYLTATSLLKRTHSIKSISDVLELFVDSTRYAITFKNNAEFVQDIQIILPATAADYKESLQIAFDKIFTTPPYVLVSISIYFDEVYTIPVIEGIIEEVTGTDTGYTVVYSIVDKKAVFTITLDNSLAQYEEEVKDAVEAHFADADDVVIVVVVE